MKTIWLTIAVLLAGPALAGATEAQRYIDAQGVEVIHNRTVAVDTPAAAPMAGKRRAVAAPVAELAPASIRVDARMRIPADEQARRDSDRIAILNQELMTEAKAYEAKWKTLNAPGADAALPAPELARLKEEISGHERNIRALNAELRRTHATR
jgi:hypothetical protein